MTIAYHVRTFLNENNIRYDIVHHPYSEGAIQTAISAQIPLANMAKAIILQDHDGHCLMAVIPSNHKLKVRALEKLTQRGLHLASESLLFDIFDDCEPGAIPAIGPAYRMETYLDESLLSHPDIYLECGDHQNVMHMGKEQFAQLMASAKKGQISASMQPDSPYHGTDPRFVWTH